MGGIYLGIDIAKAKFDVALLQEDKYQHKVFTNNELGIANLLTWLSEKVLSWDKLYVIMEATGNYHLVLACALVEQGINVSVENPSKLNAFAKACLMRGKDDKRDAKLIAQYGKACRPAAWKKPRDEVLQLQSLLAEYDSLKEQQVMVNNRLKSLTPLSHHEVTLSIQAQLDFLDNALKAIEASIQAHVDQFPDTLQRPVVLAQSVPGVGFFTALRFVVTTESGTRFKKARQLAAYLGLTPMVKHSGNNQRTPARLSKIGQGKFRAKLYFPAIQAIIHNPDVKYFYEQLINRGKRKMTAILAAMRKLVHIVFGVLKQNTPYQVQKKILATN